MKENENINWLNDFEGFLHGIYTSKLIELVKINLKIV